MALRIGIIGLGFMGKFHFGVYQRIEGAKVVAICDVDEMKLRGDWSSIGGNIGDDGGQQQDLSGIRTYNRADRLFADGEVDVVDVTLPTHLHAEAAVSALRAGKHVICEKPMARTSAQARRMIHAASKASRRLFVAHCIRFWPHYAKARQVVMAGQYGKVISAVFTRLSGTPIWSYQNWLQNPGKSGLCALDMHIHDADFILYTFGKPDAVTSRGSGFRKGRLDHIVTTYEYRDNLLVTAEGGWDYAGEYPFSMSFRIAMKKAAIAFQGGELMLYPLGGQGRKVDVDDGDAYENELREFVQCIANGRDSEIAPACSAVRSVQLVEAEMNSALTGKKVKVSF
ncbi:MAG: Gfo/Idh/MocA family oxidoreductase [Planctomycetes bacterium]|nr:Gfo/Idh/MocA family oxidoreductase [Planctomycetota bacterium]